MLIPWYHYVPTKLDYSDILYVIYTNYFIFFAFAKTVRLMSFFFFSFFLQRYPGVLSGIT